MFSEHINVLLKIEFKIISTANVGMLFGHINSQVSVHVCPFSIRIPKQLWPSIPSLQVLFDCVHHVPCFCRAFSSSNQHWILALLHICTLHADARNIHEQRQWSCILGAQYLGFQDIACHSFGIVVLLKKGNCGQELLASCLCL